MRRSKEWYRAGFLKLIILHLKLGVYDAIVNFNSGRKVTLDIGFN